MINRFLEYCKKNGLIWKNDSILMAISGGPDSIFMLKLFLEIKENYDLKIGVAYINHKQRDVKKEVSFIKAFSEKFNLPFFYKEINLKKNRSNEEILRIQRLEALKEIANKNGFKKIALAHTKDDQAETILMRFLKGAGLRGLSGIKPESQGIFIHPILCFSRNEIINYLKNEKIKFFQDPSNYSFHYLRNKLRHLVIPFLEREINPSLKENLIRMAEILKEDEAYISEMARKEMEKALIDKNPFPKIDRGLFLSLNNSIKRRILISILQSFNFRWESKHVDLLLNFIENKPEGQAKFLGKNLTFITTCDNIFICPFFIPPKPIYLERKKEVFLPLWGGKICLSKKKMENSIKVDIDLIEKIKLTSLYHEKKLLKKIKKIGIPNPIRRFLPVFTLNGEIIWIPGYYKKEIDAKNKIYMRWEYGISKNP